MTPLRVLGAILGGLLLAAMPLARFVFVTGHGAPHADHEPRHGGQVGMSGDYHIEVRRRAGRIETFVSDPRRRPVRPEGVSVAYDGGETIPLQAERDRWIGEDDASARTIEANVLLADGTRLQMTFDFGEPSPTPASGAGTPSPDRA
jgi:hypothetical protein